MLSQYIYKVWLLVFTGICLTACGSDDSNPQKSSQNSVVSSSAMSSSSALSVSSSSSSFATMSSNSSTSSVQSSDVMSSSSASEAYLAEVQFIYPTQYAHVGGITETAIRLNVLDASQLSAAITQIMVGDIELTLQGSEWVSVSPLALSTLNDQAFSVELILADNTRVELEDLVLHNQGGKASTKAGTQRIHSIKGLALDVSTQRLYASDPLEATVYALDLKNQQVTKLLTTTASEDKVASLSWPMAFDPDNSELYILQDSFSYSEALGAQKYGAVLHKINALTGQRISYEDTEKNDDDFRISSTKGLFVDTKQSFLGDKSADKATVFTFDFLRPNSLAAWFIDNNDVGVSESFNAGTHLDEDAGLLAFTYNPMSKQLFVLSEFDDTNKRGVVSLIGIKAKRVGNRISLRSEILLKTPELWKPTAILMSPDTSTLWVADSARIWSIDVATQAVSLLSSSNILPKVKGDGVYLSHNITAMVLDDKANILYAAADGDGVIAIDLITGNRITVLK